MSPSLLSLGAQYVLGAPLVPGEWSLVSVGGLGEQSSLLCVLVSLSVQQCLPFTCTESALSIMTHFEATVGTDCHCGMQSHEALPKWKEKGNRLISDFSVVNHLFR